MNVFNW